MGACSSKSVIATTSPPSRPAAVGGAPSPPPLRQEAHGYDEVAKKTTNSANSGSSSATSDTADTPCLPVVQERQCLQSILKLKSTAPAEELALNSPDYHNLCIKAHQETTGVPKSVWWNDFKGQSKGTTEEAALPT